MLAALRRISFAETNQRQTSKSNLDAAKIGGLADWRIAMDSRTAVLIRRVPVSIRLWSTTAARPEECVQFDAEPVRSALRMHVTVCTSVFNWICLSNIWIVFLSAGRSPSAASGRDAAAS